VREFQQSTIHGAVPAEFFERVVGESMLVPVHVWKSAIASFVSNDARVDVRRIAAPTLIIAGELDAAFPLERSRTLQTLIRGSQLRVYAQTGHAIHWEQPGQFLFDLVSFVEATRDRVERSAALTTRDALRARD
jgi:pimeloyl-ACP methyl ester carboxylesterase